MGNNKGLFLPLAISSRGCWFFHSLVLKSRGSIDVLCTEFGQQQVAFLYRIRSRKAKRSLVLFMGLGGVSWKGLEII